MIEQAEPLICEDVLPANLRALAAAVINQAVSDLTAKRKTPEKRLEALFWLAGDEFEIWCDFADVTLNVYKLLPKLSEAKQRLKRRITK